MSHSNSIECHSIEQLEILRDISINSNLGVREALFLTTQLVNHGHRGAFELISELRRDLGEGYAGSYLDRLESRLFAISELPDFYSSFENPDLVKSLYATTVIVFAKEHFVVKSLL
jgi:hypothetical protein